MTRLVIVGTGDHARVIEDLARVAGHDVLGFVDLDPGRQVAASAEPLPVLGDLTKRLDWIDAQDRPSVVVAIGGNEQRRRAFDRCTELGLVPVAVIHPTAVLLGGCSVELGAQICAMAMIGVGAWVGPNVIVNSMASVDHDVVLERHAFVGPGARLAGRVKVGEGAHVGIGAVIREGTMIGAGALVAAGAVVVADVSPTARVAGVPARPMKA